MVWYLSEVKFTTYGDMLLGLPNDTVLLLKSLLLSNVVVQMVASAVTSGVSGTTGVSGVSGSSTGSVPWQEQAPSVNNAARRYNERRFILITLILLQA